MGSEIPTYQHLPSAPLGGRSAWGLFGADDSVGTLNRLDTASVLYATGLVQSGKVFALNASNEDVSPALFGRHAPEHRVLVRPDGRSMDDYLDRFYPQASSQWDSLAHVAYLDGTFYNCRSVDDILTRRVNTIDHWARRGIVGRGVLLDVWRDALRNGASYDPGTSYGISVDDLEAARAHAGVDYRPGDIILINTGYLNWYRRLDGESRQDIVEQDTLAAVGLEHTERMAEYLWNTGAAAVASDCPAIEVWPPETDANATPFGYLHRVLIGLLGFALGELWWLEDLAHDCANDGRHEFLVTSSPLNVVGGIGSPANALAIK